MSKVILTMLKTTQNIDTIKTSLQEEIYSSLIESYPGCAKLISKEWIDITSPKEQNNGDYTTTVALKLAKAVKKSPMEIAEKIVQSVKRKGERVRELGIDKIEVRPPGFVNFFLSNNFIITQVNSLLEKGHTIGVNNIGRQKLEQFLKRQSKDIKIDHPAERDHRNIRIMFEYAHPNTHKEFHIGHLRNIIIAESLIRLFENMGVEVIRVNYQGDVGMHIAKCLWGLIKRKAKSEKVKSEIENEKTKDIYGKVKFLGEAYVAGNKAYEESEEAKKEIIEINRKIYDKDPQILKLWKETRQWSLEYFEIMYKRVGSHYDRYYFESEVYESGKKIVEDFLKKNIFEKSEGAIIFPGEKHGLHNRVFITGQGFPTYEAKDMGLGVLQFKEYDPDLIIHVVGPEQAGYFQVIFKALEQTIPKSSGREMHFIYGWVQLKQGKMSSRKGNVVTGKWLLDEAKKFALKIMQDSKDEYSQKELEEISEKVAVAATKYSMLKFSPKSDILFDFQESVSLEGDSGPYILYTDARTRSVLRKFQLPNTNNQTNFKFQMTNYQMNNDEIMLLRTLYKFPEVTLEAGGNMAPNLLANYLFNLAQKFNLFYTNHSILTPKEGKEEVKNFRIALTKAVSVVLDRGLYLLGIPVVEKM